MTQERLDRLPGCSLSCHVSRGVVRVLVVEGIVFYLEQNSNSQTLSVIVRESRAGRKDRNRPLTFIFLQYESYSKRLTTMMFAEVGVRFSSRYPHIMILASQAV